jgi:hypothetical protein
LQEKIKFNMPNATLVTSNRYETITATTRKQGFDTRAIKFIIFEVQSLVCGSVVKIPA